MIPIIRILGCIFALLATASATTVCRAGSLIFSQMSRSPDGHYAVHQPHMTGVRKITAFFFKTTYGYIRQSEYSTAYGPLTVVQAPLSKTLDSTPSRFSSHFNPGARGVASLTTTPDATGHTTHGATWTLGDDGRRKRLDLAFPDSVVTVTAPATRINRLVIAAFVESIY